eukprot:TRINITY_DN3597_c0_g1_i1.p1 TRINITY_DN3597_c0_g1~~TRINITY_DN3597_c0_g1_i1.p1  ORF type:complete len:106 (+),score=8.79 TRINITY_DN3597_c0_g1_i1:79-396(+)
MARRDQEAVLAQILTGAQEALELPEVNPPYARRSQMYHTVITNDSVFPDPFLLEYFVPSGGPHLDVLSWFCLPSRWHCSSSPQLWKLCQQAVLMWVRLLCWRMPS